MQTSFNITKPFNSNTYARDSVIALALALNETLEHPSLNLSLHAALEHVIFNGASVSSSIVHQVILFIYYSTTIVLHNRVL